LGNQDIHRSCHHASSEQKPLINPDNREWGLWMTLSTHGLWLLFVNPRGSIQCPLLTAFPISVHQRRLAVY
jgi:hypothetical protein